jgi:hypothetical protein
MAIRQNIPTFLRRYKSLFERLEKQVYLLILGPQHWSGLETDGFAILAGRDMDMNHPVAEEARLNALVHQTSCNFKKVPGHTYFVYKQRKHPDKEFISMISPQVQFGY